MSSTYLVCPMTGVGEEHVTEAQAQALLDEAYADWERDSALHGRYSPAGQHPVTNRRYIPTQLIQSSMGGCQFVNKGTDEPARPPWKGYGMTAIEYRQEYQHGWECQKHRVEPVIWFQYGAANKRISQARSDARLKQVHLKPSQMEAGGVHMNYRYSWWLNIWVSDRPMPKLMHAIFSEQYAPQK